METVCTETCRPFLLSYKEVFKVKHENDNVEIKRNCVKLSANSFLRKSYWQEKDICRVHKKRKGWISYPQFPQYIHNFIHMGHAGNQGKYELFTKLSTLSTFLGKVCGDKKSEKETNVLCLISKRSLFSTGNSQKHGLQK